MTAVTNTVVSVALTAHTLESSQLLVVGLDSRQSANFVLVRDLSNSFPEYAEVSTVAGCIFFQIQHRIRHCIVDASFL